MHAHTHRSAGTRVCTPLPALPLPWWGGWAGATSPEGNNLLKDLIWHFYIQLTACNIPKQKKKKKNYLFACLKRHKDNIHVCDPDCLWSRGREIVQTALPSSTPGCLPGNRAAVPEGRVRSPSLQLTLLAVPLVTTEEVNGTHRGLGLHSPTPVLLTYTAKMPVP